MTTRPASESNANKNNTESTSPQDSTEPAPETLAEFKSSFAYGTRSELSFKFLKALSDDDAGQFFQGVLTRLTDVFDSGAVETSTVETSTVESSALAQLHAHVYEWQAKAYSGAGRWTYDDGPFVPLDKPLNAARLALFTSSGHFVDGDDPEPLGVKNMTQAEAAERIDDFLREEPTLSAIPIDTPAAQLRVRHGGYDVRSAQRDPNVAFPLELLRELAEAGDFGALTPDAYSFVGACAQTPLLKRTAPRWAELLQDAHADGAVLVPV